MRHPELPPSQTIPADERQVQHYGSAGWVVVEEPEPPAPRAVSSKAPAGAEVEVPSEPAPDKPSRRRTTKEDET